MPSPQKTITARTFRYSEISEGQRETHQYRLDESVYRHFLAAFQDHSPLHVDAEFARSRNFSGPVMHGTLLNGFISHFAGMWFPGRLSLLLGVDLRYANPSYLGDTVRLDARVSQKMDARQIVVLDVTLNNETQGNLAARGRIQVMVRDEA